MAPIALALVGLPPFPAISSLLPACTSTLCHRSWLLLAAVAVGRCYCRYGRRHPCRLQAVFACFLHRHPGHAARFNGNLRKGLLSLVGSAQRSRRGVAGACLSLPRASAVLSAAQGVAFFCFVLGLDESRDPWRLCHGCWHVFMGVALYHFAGGCVDAAPAQQSWPAAPADTSAADHSRSSSSSSSSKEHAPGPTHARRGKGSARSRTPR